MGDGWGIRRWGIIAGGDCNRGVGEDVFSVGEMMGINGGDCNHGVGAWLMGDNGLEMMGITGDDCKRGVGVNKHLVDGT